MPFLVIALVAWATVIFVNVTKPKSTIKLSAPQEELATNARLSVFLDHLGDAPKLTYPKVPATVANPCPRSITVAVVDTGLDYNHPSVRQNLWKNDRPGRFGYVNDMLGWNFVRDQPEPYDTHGHGTHVTGLILGVQQPYHPNEFDKIVECTPVFKIMALVYYNNQGLGYNNLANTIRAFRYAVTHGADIINYSGGGSEPSVMEHAVLEEARKAGVLVVAAAGNDGNDRPYYPASYALSNVLSVASHNKEKILLPSSNYGPGFDVAAPGLMQYSSLPEGRFGTMSGTSQAVGHVTRLAATLMSLTKDRDYVAVRDAITTSAIQFKHAKYRVKFGRVSPKAAVKKFTNAKHLTIR